MIRVEIDIDERITGKVDISCRSFEDRWRRTTQTERAFADEVAAVMCRGLDCTSRILCDVETCEGEAVERLQREGQV